MAGVFSFQHILYVFCIKFIFYKTGSLRQGTLANDKSLTVLLCKQDGGASSEREQN